MHKLAGDLTHASFDPQPDSVPVRDSKPCAWRITNYDLNSTACIDLFLSETFPTLLFMKDLLIRIAHLLATIATLLRPGGARAIVADCLLTKQQLRIINRTRHRSQKLTHLDRFMMNFCALFLLRRHSESCGNYPTLNVVEISSIDQNNANIDYFIPPVAIANRVHRAPPRRS